MFLKEILPETYILKLGTGSEKEENPIALFFVNANFEDFSDTIPPNTEYLVIESGSIWQKISYDCLIFMENEIGDTNSSSVLQSNIGREPKESASGLKEKADLVSSGKVFCCKAWELAEKLNMPKEKMGLILNHLRIKVIHCQLGLF